ncbi:BolA family transcriptional regulator [Suttonella sp. R2A3]|uniref:BolA family protein n=1 Tax=Suttonella sp. R2A3 TaxID=2908648 RepID=UPI001F1FABB3|nr:BolA family protein [Suttonella sp. R2A3]UJF23797.1 BolA family transcriptional regulator [Suttonella sp. R2A3]
MPTPIADAINEALRALSPKHLDVLNESAQHAHYQPGAETHFKVTVVSEDFSGLSRVRRHQKVYQCVNPLLKQGGGEVHALALHTYTPEEWQARAQKGPDSPPCAGQR